MFCPQASWLAFRCSGARLDHGSVFDCTDREFFTSWQKFALDSLDLGMAVGCQQDVEGAVNI